MKFIRYSEPGMSKEDFERFVKSPMADLIIEHNIVMLCYSENFEEYDTCLVKLIKLNSDKEKVIWRISKN